MIQQNGNNNLQQQQKQQNQSQHLQQQPQFQYERSQCRFNKVTDAATTLAGFFAPIGRTDSEPSVGIRFANLGQTKRSKFIGQVKQNAPSMTRGSCKFDKKLEKKIDSAFTAVKLANVKSAIEKSAEVKLQGVVKAASIKSASVKSAVGKSAEIKPAGIVNITSIYSADVESFNVKPVLAGSDVSSLNEINACTSSRNGANRRNRTQFTAWQVS